MVCLAEQKKTRSCVERRYFHPTGREVRQSNSSPLSIAPRFHLHSGSEAVPLVAPTIKARTLNHYSRTLENSDVLCSLAAQERADPPARI